MRASRLFAALALLAGCQMQKAPPPTPAPPEPEVEIRELIQQGRTDEALSRLEGLPGGPSTWLLQGEAWARKAETAPLPTPPPPPVPLPRGAEAPRAPEFKPEELKALEFFERALAASPQLAGPALGIAELLAPHALRRHEAEAQAQARAQKRPRRGAPAPAAVATPAPGEPDWSYDRILRAYQQAATEAEGGDPKVALESWTRFALAVGRNDDADLALREMIKRDHESADPLVRYGDFLAQVRKQPLLAVEQYQQALIWRPDDAAVKARMADIYLDLGFESLGRKEYMAAQVRFDEARKYVGTADTPQAQRLRGYQQQLQEIRRGAR